MAEEDNIQRRKSIEATVLDLLKYADFETATELTIRTATAHRLGIDRFDLDQKQLIRTVLESFLLSTATHKIISNNNNDVQRIEAGVNNEVQPTEAVRQEDNDISGAISCEHNNNKSSFICELSLTRNVKVRNFGGQPMVTIQDYHQKDGIYFPKSGGMSLTTEQWLCIKNNIPAIEEAITRMKSRLPTGCKPSKPAASGLLVDSAQANATVDSKRMEDSTSNSDSIANLQELKLEGSKQIEVNSNASTTLNSLCHTPPNSVQDPLGNHISQPSGSASTENLHHNSSISRPPPGLMHMPVRLDGTNYYLWKHQMELSLSELKVIYVLTEACPSFSSTFTGTREEEDQAKALARKWVDDNYICRSKILTCLGDNLYNDYSRKDCSAKELWEELKSAYNEDIGTNRSQVNKYVQFQIVDGISVLQQVHELQRIAHSICASGIGIEEYFHVCVIISKLPPSWKEFRLRMMREEFLPLHMLMHRLKVEEDARNGKQPAKPSGHRILSKCESRITSHDGHGVGSKCASRVGSQRKKHCYNCMKSGHISKNCPDRKAEVCDNGTTKENGHRLKGDHGYQS